MTAKESKAVAGTLYVCFDKNMERRLFHMRDTAERHTIGGIDVYIPESALHAAESLLAEAEKDRDDHKFAASTLHTNLIAAYAERDSLQSRLDAVGRLADQLEAHARQQRGRGYDECNPLVYFSEDHAKAIRRAALGCESPGNDEVGS